MNRHYGYIPCLLALSALGACGGGGGDPGERGDTFASSDVAVRFSDAPVDELAQVVITVDSMTFRRGGDSDANDLESEGDGDGDGGSDIVVERFTSEELGIIDAETFTIDLLDVQGEESRLVLDSIELPVGSYSDLRLDILDEDVNFSYVEESSGGELKQLKVPSGELKLGAFDVSPLSTQTFVVEFGLRQSMTYNPGPDRYILKPRGVRIVQLEQAAVIEGDVDLVALHEGAPCNAKDDPSVGNAVYLYAGHALDVAALADDFDASIAGDEASSRLAPIASATLGPDGRFVLAYLEPGDYTLAASCEAANDDADTLDPAIRVPSPAGQLVETTLTRGERRVCSLGTATPVCASADSTP